MKVQKFENNNYVIRIEPGEPLMAKLAEFARNEQIGFAWVSVIGGGFKKIKYAFSVGFNTGYIIKDVDGGDQGFELLSAEGCIAWDDNDLSKPAVHLHASFIDNKLEKSFGGHLMEVEVVGLTAEVKLTILSSKEKITRRLVPEVNVPLLNLPDYSPSQDKTSKPDEQGGGQQGQSEEIEKLKKELAEAKKKKSRIT